MMEKVIFLHILKTGGTSMLHMLFEQYGVSGFHPVPISTSTWEVEYPALRGVTALDWQKQINTATVHHYGVIAGHYDWGLAKRLQGWTVVTLLRDPVEQIRSLYQYMVASRNEVPEADWMEQIGFEEWVQSNHARPFLNAQTTYLSGHHVRDLFVALANLRSDRVAFGLLEEFEASVERWNERFGWSMVIQHHNQAEKPLRLTKRTRKMVEDLQHQDMVLYREAVALFNDVTVTYDPIDYLDK